MFHFNFLLKRSWPPIIYYKKFPLIKDFEIYEVWSWSLEMIYYLDGRTKVCIKRPLVNLSLTETHRAYWLLFGEYMAIEVMLKSFRYPRKQRLQLLLRQSYCMSFGEYIHTNYLIPKLRDHYNKKMMRQLITNDIIKKDCLSKQSKIINNLCKN